MKINISKLAIALMLILTTGSAQDLLILNSGAQFNIRFIELAGNAAVIEKVVVDGISTGATAQQHVPLALIKTIHLASGELLTQENGFGATGATGITEPPDLTSFGPGPGQSGRLQQQTLEKSLAIMAESQARIAEVVVKRWELDIILITLYFILTLIAVSQAA